MDSPLFIFNCRVVVDQPRVLTSLVRRETLRDAFELWITPLVAVASMTGIAIFRAATAASLSFASTASRPV